MVAFSPDGAVVASGAEDGTFRLWDAGRRAQLGVPLPQGGGYAVRDVAIGSRGTIATAGGGVAIWDDLLLSRDYDAWRARICGIVRMSLSRAEWSGYFGAERYHRTCS